MRNGQTPDALSVVEESLARLHVARYELLTTSFEMVLAEALATNGRQSEALQLVDAAIQRCNGNGEFLALPELLRIKAFVVARAVPVDINACEALLRRALDISQDQGARAWELRAAIDLAELLGVSGRAGEGVALLAPLRQGFTEGADTADLQLADEVLRRLQPKA